MGLREAVYVALTEYIQGDVDQLCEEVLEVWEYSWSSYDEDEGTSDGIRVTVDYRVPPGVNRYNVKTWWFHGSLMDLIGVIESWKGRQK
jgi:hypothetical protein